MGIDKISTNNLLPDPGKNPDIPSNLANVC